MTHIHNAPTMHRVYQQPQTYIRQQHPYQMAYPPAPYYPYTAGYDPTVSLAHPYIYDPTHIKHRRRTTPDQLKILEDTFKTDPKPNPSLRKQLSLQLGMSPRVLQVWFQNRRMKVKRLAKKQSAAEQRPPSPDAHDDADPSSPVASPAKSPSSLPDAHDDASCSPVPSSDSAADSPSVSAGRPDLARRGSLPALASTVTFALNDALSSPVAASPDRARSSSVVEGVPDPTLCRRRSLNSLLRLEFHPFAPLVAASNGIQPSSDHQPQDFPPIVPPSLHPTFRTPRFPGSAVYHHHHSPSTPATRPVIGVMPHANRAASFHVIPDEHRLHAFSLMRPPYAFPPRPVPAPGPGPLPAADYSFGTSTPPREEDTQEEFDVRPYVPSVSTASYSVQATAAAAAGVAFTVPRLMRQDDDTDASTSYTGYSSRFGSIASAAESDTSTGASVSGRSVCGGTTSVSSASGSAGAGAWDGNDRWVEEGRRGSWTGQVAEMLSGLDVRGDTGKAEEMTYDSMWDPSNVDQHAVYTSSSSQESLAVYTHPPAGTASEDELSYPTPDESTPPAPASQPRYTASSYSISQSSELAYALGGMSEKQHQQQQRHQHHQPQRQQTYTQSSHGQRGDEMLEMHHALAAYDCASTEDLSAYSAFAAPDHDGDMPYSMY